MRENGQRWLSPNRKVEKNLGRNKAHRLTYLLNCVLVGITVSLTPIAPPQRTFAQSSPFPPGNPDRIIKQELEFLYDLEQDIFVPGYDTITAVTDYAVIPPTVTGRAEYDQKTHHIIYTSPNGDITTIPFSAISGEIWQRDPTEFIAIKTINLPSLEESDSQYPNPNIFYDKKLIPPTFIDIQTLAEKYHIYFILPLPKSTEIYIDETALQPGGLLSGLVSHDGSQTIVIWYPGSFADRALEPYEASLFPTEVQDLVRWAIPNSAYELKYTRKNYLKGIANQLERLLIVKASANFANMQPDEKAEINLQIGKLRYLQKLVPTMGDEKFIELLTSTSQPGFSPPARAIAHFDERVVVIAFDTLRTSSRSFTEAGSPKVTIFFQPDTGETNILYIPEYVSAGPKPNTARWYHTVTLAGPPFINGYIYDMDSSTEVLGHEAEHLKLEVHNQGFSSMTTLPHAGKEWHSTTTQVTTNEEWITDYTTAAEETMADSKTLAGLKERDFKAAIIVGVPINQSDSDDHTNPTIMYIPD